MQLKGVSVKVLTFGKDAKVSKINPNPVHL